ncbi:hypothetical protein KM043_015156 [Ampulex compressa]|nr:hypothetical protein KM043_015156 [Ampulex compressa]
MSLKNFGTMPRLDYQASLFIRLFFRPTPENGSAEKRKGTCTNANRSGIRGLDFRLRKSLVSSPSQRRDCDRSRPREYDIVVYDEREADRYLKRVPSLRACPVITISFLHTEETALLRARKAEPITAEWAMDKNTKFPQSSSKGTVGDANKNQDGINSKLFPKSSRKREPAGACNFSKYEQSKKYNVQKGKNFDKRPKPKRQYHGGPKEDTKVVENGFAEYGAVVLQGSKKQNLNHLLNFHYEPEDVQRRSSAWSYGNSVRKYKCNGNRWLPPVQRHKYNKEQFLQASCQFVVTANKDYSLYLTDPDVLVEWKLIEQIKLHSVERMSCPICLCPPIAGKMTRCGHVYCWPCILHYLSLSDKEWCKCPICYESVYKCDLKSVVEISQNALNSGDVVTLRLMRREKGSLLATPVGSTIHNPTNFLSASKNTNNQIYSKLLLANVHDVRNILEWERVELKNELMDNPDSPENCYVEQALNELLIREEELPKKNEAHPREKSSVDDARKVTSPTDMQGGRKERTIEENAQSNERCNNNRDSDLNLLYDQTTGKSTETSTGNIISPQSVQKVFYFYQADDGQHVYLHAVNVKMLEMQYGSLGNSPHTITGKLLEKESGSFTEELRRRLRYLSHLPLTCQFEVAEIELKPPIVSEEVLSHFHDQLALRQKRRQCREREERKRERQITEEENKRIGKYPIPNVHIDSQQHFPEWQPELLFAEDRVPSPESAALSSIASSPPLSTLEEIAQVGQSEAGQKQGPSFAEMLRNTGARSKSGKPWPSINSTKSRPTKTNRSYSDTDEEQNYASVPPYHESFGDAVAKALERIQIMDKAEKGEGAGTTRKKKKEKPTVLFATNMARTS